MSKIGKKTKKRVRSVPNSPALLLQLVALASISLLFSHHFRPILVVHCFFGFLPFRFILVSYFGSFLVHFWFHHLEWFVSGGSQQILVHFLFLHPGRFVGGGSQQILVHFFFIFIPLRFIFCFGSYSALDFCSFFISPSCTVRWWRWSVLDSCLSYFLLYFQQCGHQSPRFSFWFIF